MQPHIQQTLNDLQNKINFLIGLQSQLQQQFGVPPAAKPEPEEIKPRILQKHAKIAKKDKLVPPLRPLRPSVQNPAPSGHCRVMPITPGRAAVWFSLEHAPEPFSARTLKTELTSKQLCDLLCNSQRTGKIVQVTRRAAGQIATYKRGPNFPYAKQPSQEPGPRRETRAEMLRKTPGPTPQEKNYEAIRSSISVPRDPGAGNYE